MLAPISAEDTVRVEKFSICLSLSPYLDLWAGVALEQSAF